MIILVDGNNYITSFATIGGFDGGIEVDDERVPFGFVDNFKPKKYIYRENEIILNSDYEEELESYPHTPEKDEESNIESPNDAMFKSMISTLQKQSVQNNTNFLKIQKENEELKNRINELESKIEVSNNVNE